jgi:hypothetical protein
MSSDEDEVSLLDEGPEELKNRVGALQTETIALSEKLAEATKALKVEQTKRELFESKAKEEEKLKDALEKELETAKMDALNAKAIVEAKDSEIASLQKMAENERKGEKILQTKSSPFTNEIIRGLEKEITRLKNNNNNNNNINNNIISFSIDIYIWWRNSKRIFFCNDIRSFNRYIFIYIYSKSYFSKIKCFSKNYLKRRRKINLIQVLSSYH